MCERGEDGDDDGDDDGGGGEESDGESERGRGAGGLPAKRIGESGLCSLTLTWLDSQIDGS